MMCSSARRRISDYLDGRLRAKEYSRVAAHQESCASCSVEFEQMRSLCSAVGSLPKLPAPASLRTDLRVIASQERSALVRNHGSRLGGLWHRWRSRLDEFMRPITIPATGGLLSSVLLFGALGFTIGTATQGVGYDVPVLLFADRIDANLVPVELRSSVVLTLSLDSSGRITDYAVRDGASSFVGNPGRLQYNNISLPEFRNVLAMAQPITRDISIEFTPIVFRR